MMKSLISALILILFSNAAFAETILATVNGLVCSFCATSIEKTFKAQDAVDAVKVDLDNKLVTIHTKPTKKLDDAKVTTLITNAGYSVVNIERKK